MVNILPTSALVAKETLAALKNNIKFASAVNRAYENEYAGNIGRGYMPGATMNIPRPPRYTYRSGRVAVPQSTVMTTIPLTLSQGGCDLDFYSIEKTLSISRFERVIEAAV
ncbi:MAG: hypothetical protein ACRC1W_08285, partial [Shewanella sp.]